MSESPKNSTSDPTPAGASATSSTPPPSASSSASTSRTQPTERNSDAPGLAKSSDKNNVVEMLKSNAADSGSDGASSRRAPETDASESGGANKWTWILGGLLLISLAMHFVQAQSRASLEAQSVEYSTALDRTIVRLDEETFRANAARAKVEAIDARVGNVNTRIAELQEALKELSEITAQ